MEEDKNYKKLKMILQENSSITILSLVRYFNILKERKICSESVIDKFIKNKEI